MARVRREVAGLLFSKHNIRTKLENIEKDILVTEEQLYRKGYGQEASDLRWIAILIEKVRNALK